MKKHLDNIIQHISVEDTKEHTHPSSAIFKLLEQIAMEKSPVIPSTNRPNNTIQEFQSSLQLAVDQIVQLLPKIKCSITKRSLGQVLDTSYKLLYITEQLLPSSAKKIPHEQDMLSGEEFTVVAKKIINQYHTQLNTREQVFITPKLTSKENAFIAALKTYILENIANTKLNGDTIGQHFGISRSLEMKC